MRRLLVITRNFPPLWGGMERLNWHMAEQLAQRYAVRLIAPQGAAAHAPPGVTVREVPLLPLPRFLITAARMARDEARAFKPEVVLAGSGLTAPIAVWAARACGARTAVYVHGLDITAPHPLYRALWLPALRRIDRVIANSTPTAQLAGEAGIAAARIAVVPPGVALPSPDATARQRFRQRWNLPPGAPVLLSVGRLTARKGLREFVADVLPIIARARPDVVLVIVGEAPANALHAEVQSPESIRETARAAGVDSNVRWLGSLTEKDLHDAYFGADVHVFPVRALPNDPEGFGMVALEAAAHGLATVAYATGGVVDAVADGVSGRLVKPGQPHAFAEAVLTLLHHPLPSDPILAFAQQFAWSAFGQQLCSLLEINI